MSFLMPKTPTMPPLIMPEVKEVPSMVDEDREKEQRELLLATERKRRGRRSTILTDESLLSEDIELNKPILSSGA
jgi:hypothetical protein|tara:strand:+ start:296 stop:520 length:225 start_codon:yes stop_codon:yes gene_type:complete